MTAAYGCCGQALTRFTGHPCIGPGRVPARLRIVYTVLPTYTLSGRLIKRENMNTGTQSKPELLPHEAEAQQRTVLIHIVRMAFFVIMLTVTLLAVFGVDDATDRIELQENWVVGLIASLFLFATFLTIDFLTPRKKIAMLTAVFMGVLAGMLATLAVGAIIDLLGELWGFSEAKPLITTLKVLIGIALCYMGITTVIQTQDDFRLVLPYVEFAKQLRGPRPLLLDTSALIDSRIVDISQTGILQYPIVIPQFVVDELQLLADAQDRMKRARGRRGLDVITKMQRMPTLDLTIDQTNVPGKAVDQMLIELARLMSATIVTTDVALNRIAGIQGIKVLNINEVANALKPSLIPGEQLAIRLIKEGEQQGQAVGYLEDGTMVVAEDGAPYIGQRVVLSVRSTFQTAAGRLIFGRVDDHARPGGPDDDDSDDGTAGPVAQGEQAGEPGAPEGDGPIYTGPRKGPNRNRNPRR